MTGLPNGPHEERASQLCGVLEMQSSGIDDLAVGTVDADHPRSRADTAYRTSPLGEEGRTDRGSAALGRPLREKLTRLLGWLDR